MNVEAQEENHDPRLRFEIIRSQLKEKLAQPVKLCTSSISTAPFNEIAEGLKEEGPEAPKKRFENIRDQMKGKLFNNISLIPESLVIEAKPSLTSSNSNSNLKAEGTPKLELHKKTISRIRDNLKNSFTEQVLPISFPALEEVSTADREKECDSKDSQNSSDDEEDGISPLGKILARRKITSEIDELNEECKALIHVIYGNFKQYYEEKEVLGRGCSAIVKRCVKVGTSEEYAVKVVGYKFDEEVEYMLTKEFACRRKLIHRNIVQVYEMYIDKTKGKIYTIMEMVRGKEMFEVIQSIGQYSEKIASKMFKQILVAIQYLHCQGVCHRDLKPHNILVSKEGDIIKITDFNVSKFHNNNERYSALNSENYKMFTYTGTIAYIAPEVFSNLEYTESVDMWGAGCVLYMILCGYPPFQAETVDDLIISIQQAKYTFDSQDWDVISDQAKDLVTKLLEKDSNRRYTPIQALAHPWIVNVGRNKNKKISSTIENLKLFRHINTRRTWDECPKSEFLKKANLELRVLSPNSAVFIRKASPGEMFSLMSLSAEPSA